MAAPMLAAAVEVGLFCTLRAKRCRRVQSPSLSVPAALTAGPSAMVAPAPLTAWWQMAGRLLLRIVELAGQAAPAMQVDLELATLRLEAAVAPEDQERQDNNNPKYSHMIKVVTAARASNRPYLVPPVITAAAVAAPSTTSVVGLAEVAMEDWAEVLQGGRCLVLRLLRVQPSQGAEVVAVHI